MPGADDHLNSRTSGSQETTLQLLQDLGIMANGTLSVGEVLYRSLEAIGRHTDWPAGRIRLERVEAELTCEPVISWQNPASPVTITADDWPELGPPVAASPARLSRTPAGEPSLGYIACPIHAGGGHMATMEFMTAGSSPVEAELRQVLSHAATLIGLVIERSRAQVGLRESERRFRAIFDQSYQFIGLLEPDGTLIEVNQTSLQFAGLTLGDVVGKPFWETHWWQISPETQAELKAAIKRAARGELVHYDVEVQGVAGQTITIDFSIKPVHDLAGEVVMLIPEGRNITQLKGTLASLRQAEARLEEAQRVARMGHWEFDLLRQQGYWSQTLFSVFGLDAAAVVSPERDFLERTHPDDRALVRQKLEAAYRERGAYELTYRLVYPDGSIRRVYGAGATTVNEAGEVVRMSGIVQDVTRSWELEQSLARSVERLLQLNSVGQAVAATFDLEQIHRDMLASARAMLNADLVIFFEHEGDRLHIRAMDHDHGLVLEQCSIPADSGVAGEVWTTGRSIWLRGEECRRRRSSELAQWLGYEPRAMLTVAVRWQEEIVGVLQATHTHEDAFSEGDLDTLQAVGTWTAIAIGKARQHAVLERRLRESEALAQVSRALGETLEPQSILDLIAISAQGIIPRADWTVIHLLRGRPERLYPASSAGDAPLADAYIITPGEGVAGRSLINGQLINVADVHEDAHASQFARTAGVRSMLVVPIQSRNRTIGTISSVSSAPHTYTEEDERLITILASQAAMAIENTQLFDSQRRARTVAEMQRERLRELTRRIVTAQEDERLRISRELHDEAGQALTSLKISLDLIRTALPAEQESLRTRLADVAGLADETMETLRRLAHDLRPPGLDTFGLNVALEGLCYDLSSRTHLAINYRGLELPELSMTAALSMYRLVQEALTNVAKHADATRAAVTLTREDGHLQLVVADDGRGFEAEGESDVPRHRAGIGLVSMRERAELLGGTLDIETAPGQGTRLSARIPLEHDDSGDV